MPVLHRFLPKSLAGRHLLLLGLTFAAFQLAMAYILLFFWGTAQIKMSLDASAMHFAQTYGVLSTMQPQERLSETSVLTARRITFRVVTSIPEYTETKNAPAEFFQDRILTLLTLFRKGYEFTYYAQGSDKDAFPPKPRHRFWEAENFDDFKREAPLIATVGDAGWSLKFSPFRKGTPLFSADVQLTAFAALPFYDGTWFTAEFGSNLYNDIDITAYVLVYLAQFFLLLALVWLEIRMLLKPIKKMERDAARIDLDNPEVFPVPEHGPQEILSLAGALRDLTQRLSNQVRQKILTLAGLSHDLKTPIARMRLEVSRLEEEHPEIMKESFLGSSLDQLELISGSVISFARSGTSDETAMNINLPGMIVSVADELDPDGAHIKIMQADQAVLPLLPQSIRRCLMNIVRNALEYSVTGDSECGAGSEGGDSTYEAALLECAQKNEVHIYGKDTPEKYVILVRDFGSGIPEAMMGRIFEPFFRGEAENGAPFRKGSGLGLFIARNLAEANHADITLQNMHPGLLVSLSINKKPSAATEAETGPN
ncbi:MAG: HAMP domain-containing histidine kinase [Mailhella sp.]|nr:HAMP domain-containing histidine kinase [Mailhella sp.]